jgi:hypothetical protein
MIVLHVADYAATDPQIGRLVIEVLNRLPEAEFAVSLVSSGEALERARGLAGKLARPAGVIDSPALIHRFAVALGPDAQYSGQPTYEVLSDSFVEPDVLWFPSIHHHLPAHRGLAKVVAGVERPSLVEMAEFLADKADTVGSATATAMAAMDDMAVRRVMRSAACIVAPSRRIADYLEKTYGRAPALVVPPTPSLLAVAAEPVPALPPSYILYVGGIDPLGNHETLLMAQARLKAEGKAFPLVLAGEGADSLTDGGEHRAAYLRGLIEHLGLSLGDDVHPLGPLTPGALKTAFSQSSGAVLPALADGVALQAAAQAVELGVPLAASDMPWARDYLTRRAVSPIWFRPGAADEIAAGLQALRVAAPRPPAALPDPTWDEAAHSYSTLFRAQARLAASSAGGR